MRLRRTITIPTRYEDEDPLPPRSRNGTRPAYPSLLRDQVIPFNPDHPPAQFPSLPLSTPCPSAHKLQSDIDSTAESPTSLDDFPMESPNRHCNIHILPTRQLSSTDGDPVQNPSTNLLRGSSRTPDDLITCSSHTSAHAIPANLQEPVATLVLKERVSRRDADLSPALNASAIADGNMLSITYRNEDAAIWNALPMSLQYQIFSSLEKHHSRKHVKQLLGLTQEEFNEMSTAASLRRRHSASLAQIWRFARNGTEYVPGFPEDISIDAESFNEFSDYMVFASRFEFALQSEIHDAERYILRRGMVCDVLGSWVPDPSEPDGSPYFVRLPAIATAFVPRTDSLLDSNYSSLLGDHSDEANTLGSAMHRPSSRDCTTVGKNINGKQNSRKRRRQLHCIIATGGKARCMTSSLEKSSRPARHPLANATIIPDRSLETIADGEDGDPSEKIQYATEEQIEDVVPSTPDPSHLILKIQGKDGLARVLKKKQKSTDSTMLLSATQLEPSLRTPSLEPGHSNRANPSSLAKLDTGMSGFSNALLMESTLVEKPVLGKQDLPISESIQHAIYQSSSDALPHKRKASQEAGCMTPIKSPRTIHPNSKTPPTGIVTDDISNEHTRHTEAKLSRHRTLSLSRDFRHAVKSTSTMFLASDDSTLQQSSHASQTCLERLRSPSYSPISDNENLESYQALLRDPPRKMKISKVHRSAEAYVQWKQNQSDFSVPSIQNLPHDGSASRATMTSVVPSMIAKHDLGPSTAGVESAVLAVPKKPKITLFCKNVTDTSSSRTESSVCSTEQTTVKHQSGSYNSGSDIADTPHSPRDAVVEGVEVAYSTTKQRQLRKAGPKQNQEIASESTSDGNSETPDILRDSSGNNAVESSSEKSKTTEKRKRESASKPRGPGRPRGPRGPYRKTRERMAKEKQQQQPTSQRVAPDETMPEGDANLQLHDNHGAPMTTLEKTKKRQAMM